MDPLNPAVPGTLAAIESLINKIGKPSFFWIQNLQSLLDKFLNLALDYTYICMKL